MPEREKRKMWVNVYRPFVESVGNAYASKELADKWAGAGRIACIEVEFEPGEGLNNVDTSGQRAG